MSKTGAQGGQASEVHARVQGEGGARSPLGHQECGGDLPRVWVEARPSLPGGRRRSSSGLRSIFHGEERISQEQVRVAELERLVGAAGARAGDPKKGVRASWRHCRAETGGNCRAGRRLPGGYRVPGAGRTPQHSLLPVHGARRRSGEARHRGGCWATGPPTDTGGSPTSCGGRACASTASASGG